MLKILNAALYKLKPRQLWLGSLLVASCMHIGSSLAGPDSEQAATPELDTKNASPANASPPIARTTPKPFHATYKAKFSGFTIEATRELGTHPNGEQELIFSASTWLAQLRESSRFNWEHGQLIPQKYQYHREGLGRSRDAVLKFDWGQHRVTNNVQDKTWRMDVPDGALDKLSYQLQLRSDLLNDKKTLSYDIADGGRLKTYLFEMVGEELLDTRLGKLATVKIKKVRATGKKRVTYIWMAKHWDYLLVKLQQTEEDGKTYAIDLLRAEVDGKTVTPRLGQRRELLPTQQPITEASVSSLGQ